MATYSLQKHKRRSLLNTAKSSSSNIKYLNSPSPFQNIETSFNLIMGTILIHRNITFVGNEHQTDEKYRFLFQAYDFALNKVLSTTMPQKNIVQNKWNLQSNNLENSFVVPISTVRRKSFSSNEQSALLCSVRNISDLTWYPQCDPLQFTTVVTTVHVSLKAKFVH